MARYDVVIKNGTIVDGTQIPRYVGDIGIKDGIVQTIGFVNAGDGDKVIDADGLIVAPGYIDLHTHYDAQLFWDPYLSISSWHGITSVVIGNCGFGFAPVKPDMRERSMLSMTRVEAIPYASMKEGMPWTWETFPEYLDAVERTPKGVNILPYMPTGPLMIYAMGLDRAKAGEKPTKDETALMCHLMEEALDAGACGWSAQRLHPDGPAAAQNDYDGSPMVTDLMHDETAYAFADVLGRRNDGFMEMTLTTNDVKADRAHIEEIAHRSRRPLIHNTVQVFDNRPHVHRKILEWLDGCHQRGNRVYGQGVTTDAGLTFSFDEWNLFDESPAWREATVGTVEERKKKLADPKRREAMKQQTIKIVINSIESIVVVGPKSAENQQWLDHRIDLVAEKTGKHPIDAMLDIALADDLKTEFFAAPPGTRTDLLAEVVQNPYTLFGVSDGGAHTRFLTAGRFPTEAITRLVREHNLISLEHAHYRLSALPAMLAGFPDRGVIKKGAPADIVIYDYETLNALPGEVAHDMPGGEWRRVQRANGYRYILVNGRVTIENDKETGVHSGKLLRHGTGIRRPRAIAAE
jgi:N-acyl-D-aspartate/D-glutamate deacylase